MLKNKALENGERATYGGLIDMAWPVHYEYETLLDVLAANDELVVIEIC